MNDKEPIKSLESIDLSYCTILDKSFSGVKFTGANFRGTRFNNVDFTGASFQNCDFTESRLTDCDLLIIDDLGTELTTSVVIAALYSLLNERLLSGKSMIVSTNLNIDEIARRYSPQIASRLEGSFRGLTFVGKDIRVMKNRGL